MKLHPPAIRAAEDFARALDGTAAAHVADRYAPLVATVTLMREQPTPVARPEFVADLRSRLMTAAETELVPATRLVGAPARRTHRIRERHLGAAAAAAILVASTAGVAAAADTSLPGDTLYPVKRGIEQLQVAMNTNDAAKGAEQLRQAGVRMGEVESLLNSGGTAEEVDSALSAYRSQADKGSELLFRAFAAGDNPADIATVREFTTTQSRQIREISDLAPPTSTGQFTAVTELLGEIDQQARVLCGDCSGAAAVAPAASVTPSPEAGLTDLITAPMQHAIVTLRQQLPVNLGHQAERAERQAGIEPPAKTESPAESGSTGPAAPASPKPGQLTQPVQPLHDLVTGLTSALPLPDAVKRITQPLDDVTAPLTSILDGVLNPR